MTAPTERGVRPIAMIEPEPAYFDPPQVRRMRWWCAQCGRSEDARVVDGRFRCLVCRTEHALHTCLHCLAVPYVGHPS